jgi:DNA-directed RNA polymerase alpha subunit
MKEDTTKISPTWMSKTGGYASSMTLRDWFAGMAMKGFIVLDLTSKNDELAREVYKLADAMLKERNTKIAVEVSIDKLYSTEVNELALTVRAVNCLHAGGIRTVGDLMKTTRWDLMKIPNLGKRSLLEIEEVLKDWNLKLRDM